jgi:hypothetical protein
VYGNSFQQIHGGAELSIGGVFESLEGILMTVQSQKKITAQVLPVQAQRPRADGFPVYVTSRCTLSGSTLLKAIVAAHRGRGSRCTLQKIEDPDNQAMKAADDIARLETEELAAIHTQIPDAYDLKGMKLAPAGVPATRVYLYEEDARLNDGAGET